MNLCLDGYYPSIIGYLPSLLRDHVGFDDKMQNLSWRFRDQTKEVQATRLANLSAALFYLKKKKKRVKRAFIHSIESKQFSND